MTEILKRPHALNLQRNLCNIKGRESALGADLRAARFLLRRISNGFEHAAVDVIGGPHRIARAFRAEEHKEVCKFFGRAEAIDWRMLTCDGSQVTFPIAAFVRSQLFCGFDPIGGENEAGITVFTRMLSLITSVARVFENIISAAFVVL